MTPETVTAFFVGVLVGMGLGAVLAFRWLAGR